MACFLSLRFRNHCIIIYMYCKNCCITQYVRRYTVTRSFCPMMCSSSSEEVLPYTSSKKKNLTRLALFRISFRHYNSKSFYAESLGDPDVPQSSQVKSLGFCRQIKATRSELQLEQLCINSVTPGCLWARAQHDCHGCEARSLFNPGPLFGCQRDQGILDL